MTTTRTTVKATTMKDHALIAYALGDAPATPALRRWLATTDGKRDLARTRHALRALDGWGAATGKETSDAPPLYYGRLTTPLGPVLAAVSDRGLVGVSFDSEAEAFGAALRRRHGMTVVRSDARLAPVRRQLREYLAGTRRRFELPVDLRTVSPFQRRVLTAARRIPRGRVLSYGELARRIGSPGSSRAVGQALGRNPVPIVIPCHRVVAGGGRLGGYVGGASIKRTLLRLEGAEGRTGTWA
jgi:methylated-DNA-[protein]-cysteine S-methyltransferase